MQIKFIFFSLALTSLAACNNKSDDRPLDAFEAEKLQILAEINQVTPEPADDVYKDLLINSKRVPSLSEIYSGAVLNKTDTNQQTSLDEQGIKNLTMIKERCKVEPKLEKTDGEYKAGSTHKYSSTRKVGGENCPLMMESIDTSTTQIINADHEKKIDNSIYSGDHKEITKILQPDLLFGEGSNPIISIKSESSYQSESSRNGDTNSTKSSGSGQGQFTFKNGSTGSLNYRSLFMKMNDQERSYVYSNFKMPNADVRFGFIREGKEESYFLNGRKISKEEASRRLGVKM